MKKIFLFLALAITCVTSVFSQEIKKETFQYSKDLYLDRYYATDKIHSDKDSSLKGSPCVIFVFGGGFFTGMRNAPMYLPYYRFLAENGFQVIAIDYRLGLKPFAEKAAAAKAPAEKEKVKPKQFIGLFENSVNMAVEDLYSATAFILQHAREWEIDSSFIITSGSSAGAITVLQAEYYMCNQQNGYKTGVAYDKYLPAGFRYAGVLSFAGAILNLHSKMNWQSIPAPMQLFHGNADSNVPYNRIWTPFGSFNGSKYIAKKLTKIEAPHYFYSINNATHTVATSPMKDNLYDILGFLNTFVLKKEQWIINTGADPLHAPDLKKHLRIKDYIKANFK